MEKIDILEKIKKLGVVAVIRGPSPELTIKMVAALLAGGVSGIEITYSTPHAEDVVRELVEKFGETILLGMGTLTRPEQAALAQKAGAQFLVSPICDQELAKSMVATGLLVMIGALTPTEVYQAHRLGSDVVKIFPGSLVGPDYIKSLRRPFPQILMMPTGGVSAENVADWLSSGVVAVGAGSELCHPQLAKEGRFDEITQRAKEFCQAIEVFRTNSK